MPSIYWPMDFNSKLFSIDSQLTQEDLESLKFLCSDLLGNKKLLAIKSNLDLFKELEKQSLVVEDDCDLLAELLYIIGQHSLLRTLGTSKQAVKEALKKKRSVSLYREMLFQLYEDITSEDQKDIIYLLKVPKKHEESKKFLDVLHYLEKSDQLSENNLELLENAVGIVSQGLLRIINDYKNKRERQNARLPSLCSEHGYDEKTPLSIEAQQVPAEDRGMESLELVQHVSETVKEIDLMAENQERRMSNLSLNEQPQLEMYSMNRKHRGYCLIINNSQFVQNDPRQGSEKDAEILKNVFTWLGFDVEFHSDLTTDKIHDCLFEIQKRDHTERDCFVCCILSHGRSQVVYGTDEKVIHLSEVISYCSPKKCSTLAGKPKLFFIQACQGKDFQEAHAIQADAISPIEDRRATITIPNDADILVGMSTVDGYYSFRDIRKGSWYIQALCENLINMVPRGEDILSILTKVNNDVSKKEYLKKGKTNMKQMPQPAYTLRRKLVFPIPPAPYDSSFQKTN